MSNIINNIGYKKVISLKNLISIKDDSISTLSFVDRDNLMMKSLSADKGKEIPTHSSIGDVLVIVIDGVVEITIDNEKFELSVGESILIPMKTPHSLKALEAFKVFVIQVIS